MQHGKDNVTRELNFAKAQQHPMWTKYAIFFEKFARYVREDLNAESKTSLGRMLVSLATKFQPGHILLQQPYFFLKKLGEIPHSRVITLSAHAKKNLKSAQELYLPLLHKKEKKESRRASTMTSTVHIGEQKLAIAPSYTRADGILWRSSKPGSIGLGRENPPCTRVVFRRKR